MVALLPPRLYLQQVAVRSTIRLPQRLILYSDFCANSYSPHCCVLSRNSNEFLIGEWLMVGQGIWPLVGFIPLDVRGTQVVRNKMVEVKLIQAPSSCPGYKSSTLPYKNTSAKRLYASLTFEFGSTKCHFLAFDNGHFWQKCPFSSAKKWHFECPKLWTDSKNLAKHPSKWWGRHLGHAFSTFGWVLSQFLKITF